MNLFVVCAVLCCSVHTLGTDMFVAHTEALVNILLYAEVTYLVVMIWKTLAIGLANLHNFNNMKVAVCKKIYEKLTLSVRSLIGVPYETNSYINMLYKSFFLFLWYSFMRINQLNYWCDSSNSGDTNHIK